MWRIDRIIPGFPKLNPARAMKAVHCCLLLVIVPLFQAQAQLNVTRSWFTPTVVPDTFTGQVRFETTVTGSPSTVTFLYNSVDRPMFDDGTNGDLVAGDGTYTILFTANEIISKLTTARVFRPVIGNCRLNGTSFSLNVVGEVWTSAIGRALITPLAADAQRTDYVINFTATAAQLLAFTASNANIWSQKLYTYFEDKFDFINYVLVQGTRGNRFHFGIRNSVAGIGSSIFNNGATYGSASRLKGATVFPISSFYDGGSPTFSHETGHQWINFLSGTPYAGGSPHWPRGSIAINVMGFSISGSVGGTYSFTFTPNGSGGYVVGPGVAINTSTFNPMELYLMGLAAPAEVPDYFVLVNQNQNISSGQTLSASEVTEVNLNSHVIAVKGARNPDSTTSQKTFRFATIILSEQLLSPEAISLYDFFTRRIEAKTQLTYADGLATGMCNPFQLATGNRAFPFAKLTDEISLLSIADLGTTDIRIDFQARRGIEYQLQRSDDQLGGMWVDDGARIIPGADGLFSVTRTRSGTAKFYRLAMFY